MTLLDRYLMKRLETSPSRRTGGSRDELKRLTGVVDPRLPFEAPWKEAKAGAGSGFDIFAVRWMQARHIDYRVKAQSGQ